MHEIEPKQRIVGKNRIRVADYLKKKYKKGASIRAIAESTGRSYGFVHRILTESGVKLRSRGGNTSRRGRNRR